MYTLTAPILIISFTAIVLLKKKGICINEFSQRIEQNNHTANMNAHKVSNPSKETNDELGDIYTIINGV